MERKWVVVLCGILVLLLAFASLAVAQTGIKAVVETKALIDQAKVAGAAEYAPYQFTLAQTYFEFAIHELDEQDTPAGEDFLNRAKKSATSALERAQNVKSNM